MTEKPKKKSRPGKVYHAKKVKERKDYVKVLGWLASLLLIGYGIASGVWLGIILGLIMALALMLEQKELVTNRGLEVYYDCRVFDYTDVWSWDDITSVHREDQGHPTLVALHFGKGITTRRYCFTKADAEAIMALAKEKNPKISVGDTDVVKAKKDPARKGPTKRSGLL